MICKSCKDKEWKKRTGICEHCRWLGKGKIKTKAYEWKSSKAYDEWKTTYEQYVKFPLTFNKLEMIWAILTNKKLKTIIPADWLSKKGLKEIDRILRGKNERADFRGGSRGG